MTKKEFQCNYLTVNPNKIIYKNKSIHYYCKCKCGNERYCAYNVVKYNNIQDCGCGLYALDVAKQNYVGKQFNMLTIIDCYRDIYQNRNRIFVKCKCDCGEEVSATLTEIKNGHIKSCGCIRKFDFDRDYKNKVFHDIKVLGLIELNPKKVLCQCHCGEKFIAPLIDLLKKTRYIIGCRKCNDGKNIKYNKMKREELSNGDIKIVFYKMKNRCYNSNSSDYKWYGAKGIKICDEWLNNTNAFIDWALSNGYEKNLTIDRIDGNGNYEPSNCRWVDMEVQNNNKQKLKKYNYNGEMLTLAQISRKCGIKYRTLLGRINKGWKIEKALNTPVKKRE